MDPGRRTAPMRSIWLDFIAGWHQPPSGERPGGRQMILRRDGRLFMRSPPGGWISVVETNETFTLDEVEALAREEGYSRFVEAPPEDDEDIWL